MIADSQERDPKTFWKLEPKLRGGDKNSENPIDIQSWFNHFRKLELVYLPVGKYCVYPRMVYRQAVA